MDVSAPIRAIPDSVGLWGRRPVRVVVVGHVDHGKSTLVGRLLAETGSLPIGKIESIAEMCRRRGMPFEWAFVTDALRAERDQEITIDVSHIWFRTECRDYVLLDAPGHREFLRNMVTGAAGSDAGILVVDAVEGIKEQSLRHLFLLSLAGVRQVTAVVTKLDIAEFNESAFAAIAADVRRHSADVGLKIEQVVPVAARTGDNVVRPSGAMPWYRGPTLIEALNAFEPEPLDENKPLRFPIQGIYRFDDERTLVGRIESGRLSVGDELLFSPLNRAARVARIRRWKSHRDPLYAVAGEAIGITLDEQLFLERGAVASHRIDAPRLSDVFGLKVFWFDDKPMTKGSSFTIRVNTASIRIEIIDIRWVMDAVDLVRRQASTISRDEAGEVVVKTSHLCAIDNYAELPRTARAVVFDGTRPVGAGTLDIAGFPDQRQAKSNRARNVTRVEHRVATADRTSRFGHRAGVIWMTGLSGAGKSTIAIAAEHALFASGYNVFVLDGDNLRRGLNSDLSFSADERSENIRRAAEVAALMVEAGFIVIAALISPFRSDRQRSRASVVAIGDLETNAGFHEIFVKADFTTCEMRDPRGLYRLARAGKIAEFTGVSSPYEAPIDPNLVIDTDANSVEASVRQLVDYVRRNF
jgi:bifunctional enzyme CysN/CysC